MTTEGFRDWGHWGLKVAGDFNHKTNVTSQLMDFTPIGAVAHEAKVGGPTTFTWSDGTPTAMATTTNGVLWTGLNQGFELVAPAADEQRRVHIYLGVRAGVAELKANLSDPRTRSQVEDHINSADTTWNMRHFSVEYGYAEEGSTLTVTVEVIEAVNPAMAAVALHGVTFDGP
jgi:hypothetical protein